MEEEAVQPRVCKMCVILGANGTGKTTTLKKILTSQQERCLVVTPDDAEWRDYPLVELQTAEDFMFTGIVRHIFDPDKKTGTLARLKYFKKGIIVFDDCRSYFGSTTTPEVRQLIIRRRQREVDVFAVGHGFNEVPPVFFTFSSEIILFRTRDNIVRRKDCLRDYDKCLKAQERINKIAIKNPHYCEVINWD